jgi:hypothetical protein
VSRLRRMIVLTSGFRLKRISAEDRRSA